MKTTQTEISGLEIFAIEMFDTVAWPGHGEGVVIGMSDHDAHGKVLVVACADGREMVPFLKEVKLVKKYVGRGTKVEISDETAARLRAYAENR